MILFKDDIIGQGAYIDTMTKNTSFLKMALTLNEMGVRNNTFFLALYDRDLVGIDPHNLNDDSLELRQRIAYECKVNFWYFIREVVRVISAGTDGIPYILNRANLAQAWLFLNSLTGYLVMPRQIGKTIGMVTIVDWYLLIAGKKLTWGMFCQGGELQHDNVKRFKEIRDSLPKYLHHPSAADSNNKEGILYSELGTQLQTFIAQMDKMAADRLARGNTHAAQSWDEIAYFVNIKSSWSAATAAMNRGAQSAREAGMPAAAIITTTAGDMDSKEGKFAYEMVCDAIRFTEKLYDTQDIVQLKDVIKTNSKNGIVYMEYSYKQLGMSDEWFDEVTRSKDDKTIRKDYLNQWLHGSDNSLFTKDIIDLVVASKRDPVTTTCHDSLYVRWYANPDALLKDSVLKNKPYVLGCDTSDDVGRDFTTMCMLDPYDLKVIATLRVNSTNLMFVAGCLVHLLVLFPRSIFIPERNKNGAFLLDFVFVEFKKRGINPLKRIFNKYYQDYDPDKNIDNLNYESGLVRKNFGFTTSASSTSREFLYSRVLMTALKLASSGICDQDLVNELCGLTMKNGRVDHSDIGHDDLVISYLLACFFILFASNHKYYGIDVDEILCNVKNNGSSCTSSDKKRLQMARDQLHEFEQRLKRCSNEIMKTAYMREISRLKSIIGSDNSTNITESDIKPLAQATTDASRSLVRKMVSPDEWLAYSIF